MQNKVIQKWQEDPASGAGGSLVYAPMNFTNYTTITHGSAEIVDYGISMLNVILLAIIGILLLGIGCYCSYQYGKKKQEKQFKEE